eukprot:s1543_g32.t1
MVGVNLGTRIVKANISKIRKDHNHNPIEDVEVPLDPTALASADHTATSAAGAAADSCVTAMKTKAEDFANTILKHDASLEGPEGIKYGNYMWEPVTHGKIHFLEMFSGSAKLSQTAASQGLRVGAPIDLRTGYDLLSADGRRRAMEVIERQQPKIIHMAPDVAVPDDFDDDEPDLDAGPSGHNGPPLLPIDGDEPFNPAPVPDPDPPQETPEPEEEEEENQEDTDETIPYGSTDSDDTLDYNDLVKEDDDKTWCFLTQEQKICIILCASFD